GYNVGWILAGEWLRYTVNVTQAGTYQLDYRVASAGSSGRFYVEIDGTNVSGSINVPYTGGWQTWTTLTTQGVTLSEGIHTLYVRITGSDFNMNDIEVTAEHGGSSGGGNGCVQAGPNSDYSVEISSDAINPTMTFVPGSGGGLGTPTCLLYYGTSTTGPYSGYFVTPNVPYQINANAGETIYFYYTYSVSGGGERNSLSHGHSFLVGNCGGSRVAQMKTWELSPNPAQNYLMIRDAQQVQEVQFMSIEGKLIQAHSFDTPMDVHKLDIRQIPSGAYVLRVADWAGTWTHEILVIRK
ncbi:MAG: carbohydrate-binding protein, partial [Bacteroidota bacterium]